MNTTSNNDRKMCSTSYNTEQLNKIGNNDKKFLIEMLSSFITLASDCSEIMDSAMKKEDWLKIKTIAHKNIPSYSILGLNDMVDILKEIERDIDKEERRENTKNLVELFCQENKKVIASVHKDLEE